MEKNYFIYTSEEFELSKKCVERPDEETLVLYLKEEEIVASHIKSLFCALALESGYFVKELHERGLQATMESPFRSQFTLLIINHLVKGYIAIIKYNNEIYTSQYLSTFLDLNPFCFSKKCKWYECKFHWHEGWKNYHRNIQEKLIFQAIHNLQICREPLDHTPLCLEAVCLVVNSSHSCQLSFNNRMYYYIDIDRSKHNQEGYKSIDLELISSKNILLTMRYMDYPHIIFNYIFQAEKMQNGSYYINRRLYFSDLKDGRWFICLRALNVFNDSKYVFHIIGRQNDKSDDESLRRKSSSNTSNIISTNNNSNINHNYNNNPLPPPTIIISNSDPQIRRNGKSPQPQPLSHSQNNDNNNGGNHSPISHRLSSSIDNGDWIIVADESSAAGRKGKAELLIDFPDEENEKQNANHHHPHSHPPQHTTVNNNNKSDKLKVQNSVLTTHSCSAQRLSIDDINSLSARYLSSSSSFDHIHCHSPSSPSSSSPNPQNDDNNNNDVIPTPSPPSSSSDNSKNEVTPGADFNIHTSTNGDDDDRNKGNGKIGGGNISAQLHVKPPAVPPNQFLCPITKQLMKQPVVASDGHSYEYRAISKWLEGFIRSPMTGQEMSSKIIIPNFNLKSQIDEWLALHPDYSDD